MQKRSGEQAFIGLSYWIGIITIALSIAFSTLACMGFQGMYSAITKKLYRFCGHLQLISLEDDQPISLSKIDHWLKALPELSGVKTTPYIQKKALLQLNDQVVGALMQGENTERLMHLAHPGQDPSLLKFLKGRKPGIIMSKNMALKHRLRPGMELQVCFIQSPPRYRKMRITALYETFIEEIDQKIIFTSLGFLQKLNKWCDDEVEGLYLSLPEEGKKVQDLCRSSLKKTLPMTLKLRKTRKQYQQIFDWLDLSVNNVIFLIVLILLVAATNTASVLLLQAMARSHLVGVLQVLGASKWLISKVFWAYSIRMIMHGLLIGNGLTLLGFGMQHYFKIITLDPIQYYIPHIVLTWNPIIIVVTNLLTVTITFIATGITLWRIQKIAIPQALVYSDA